MPNPSALRVGYVVKRFPRYSETFILNEILALEAAGLELEIFSLRPPNDAHFQDRLSRVRAAVHYLPGESIKAADFWSAIHHASSVLPDIYASLGEARSEQICDVFQALVLARTAVTTGIDHLHAHFATQTATVARLAARFAAIPFSFTAHAKDIFHESVRADDFERKLNDAAAVVTVSDFNVSFLQHTYGSSAAHVTRIYNGLDLDRFPYDAPDIRPPAIIAVGRLVEKKGFDDLIDACALLAVHRSDFVCRIVGTGELEALLRDRISRLELGHVVELLGPRPQPDVIELVGQAAVFAAPCVIGEDGNRDGLPTTLIEAMALGTPCVATAVTGIPELVRHEFTGLIVPQRNPPALAEALGRLLDDQALRVTLAARARQLIASEFDASINCGRLRALFEQAAAARPRAAAHELVT